MAEKKATKQTKESNESAEACGCGCSCCSPNDKPTKGGSENQMCCSGSKFWSWMCKPVDIKRNKN